MSETSRQRIARIRATAFDLKNEATGVRLALPPNTRQIDLAAAEKHLQLAIGSLSNALATQGAAL